ncbi:hypothetical protein [Flavobacterium sp. Root901]|uniref:hypothetical protein n=1 Tax=Flavobacterium sp. Root901 TaxID=1736605 RepID=UPI000A58CBA1|nr:hypothetical protein [Flavobacterium sp. Root901]
MKKLYKIDSSGKILYAEYWIDSNKAIIHTGIVGKTGKTLNIVLSDDLKKSDDYFGQRFKNVGFTEFLDDKLYWLVVQYKMKSLKGNTRDCWLKDKVTEYLNEELGWKGLGAVDGFDMGQSAADPKKFVLNIFCLVVDEEIGISAIKRCLREYRLDYTQIKIASRQNLSDSQYKLKYSAKKNDQTFSL